MMSGQHRAALVTCASDGSDPAENDNDNFWKSLGSSSSPLSCAKTNKQQQSQQHPVLLFRALHDMEESLRCLICHGLFCNPVQIEPCHHSFCSECIRKTLSSQKKRFTSVKTGSGGKLDCPVCRSPVDGSMDFSKSIVPNRSLEETVRHYKSMRLLLRDALSSSSSSSSSEATTSTATTSSWQEDTTTATVSNEKWSDNPKPLTRIRPVVYHQYKKKQLQELCRKLGLSTNGSEEDLARRHGAYRFKHNAECDSSNPRAVEELVHEFNYEEAAQYRGIVRDNQHKDKLQKLYETGGTTTGDPTTDEKMKNNFSEMIRQLRERKKREALEKQQQRQQHQPSPLRTTTTSSHSGLSETQSDTNKEENLLQPNGSSSVGGAGPMHEFADNKPSALEKGDIVPLEQPTEAVTTTATTVSSKHQQADSSPFRPDVRLPVLTSNKNTSSNNDTNNTNSANSAANNNHGSYSPWNDMYLKLVEFQRVNGHCNVPKNAGHDEKLVTWVKNQKSILGKVKRETSPQNNTINNNSSTATASVTKYQDRIAKLDALQFDWPQQHPQRSTTTTTTTTALVEEAETTTTAAVVVSTKELATDRNHSSTSTTTRPHPMEAYYAAIRKTLKATAAAATTTSMTEDNIAESGLHTSSTRKKRPSADAFFFSPQQKQQQPVEKRPKTRTNGIRSDGPWECSQCTFHNHVHILAKSSCQVCGCVRSRTAKLIPPHR